MDGIHKFIPLGYRCSSAGILRKMGLKLESYPFDWLISRLDVITDCLINGFDEFLNLENYVQFRSETNDYKEDGSKVLITEENIMYNQNYQTVPPDNPKETYHHNLALSHHNLYDQKVYDYMLRCIGRLQSLLVDDIRKMYVHIHPLRYLQQYLKDVDKLMDSFVKFHENILKHATHISGLFFIPVRNTIEVCSTQLQGTDGDSSHELTPQQCHVDKTVRIECIYNRADCRIYTLYCNEGLIDSGETFQGECAVEVELICKTIREKVIEETRDFLLGLHA